MTLWPIFGTTNQLLAGLALLVITVWLLIVVASAIFILALWLVGEAYLALRSAKNENRQTA